MNSPVPPFRFDPVEGVEVADVAPVILPFHFLALLNNLGPSEFGHPPMHQSVLPLALHFPILVSESANTIRHSFFGLALIKSTCSAPIVASILPLHGFSGPLHLQVQLCSEVAHFSLELSDPVAKRVRDNFFFRIP